MTAGRLLAAQVYVGAPGGRRPPPPAVRILAVMGGPEPRADTWRASRAWQGVVAAVAVVSTVVNTIVMWSDGVAAWWSAQVAPDDDDESMLPGPLRALLEARPDLGDAELHAVAWSVPAFLAVVALAFGGRGADATSVRRVGVAAGAVWAWSVVVESLQPVVSDTRGFEWIDVAGNSVGVVLGAAAATWWCARARRSRRTNAPGHATIGEARSTARGPAGGSADDRRSR
jgi:hypothetical protein